MADLWRKNVHPPVPHLNTACPPASMLRLTLLDLVFSSFPLSVSSGQEKHGWPSWDDVVFSHMTPFAFATVRQLSGVSTNRSKKGGNGGGGGEGCRILCLTVKVVGNTDGVLLFVRLFHCHRSS